MGLKTITRAAGVGFCILALCAVGNASRVASESESALEAEAQAGGRFLRRIKNAVRQVVEKAKETPKAPQVEGDANEPLQRELLDDVRAASWLSMAMYAVNDDKFIEKEVLKSYLAGAPVPRVEEGSRLDLPGGRHVETIKIFTPLSALKNKVAPVGVFAERSRKTLWVVCRGSASLEDWMHDAAAASVNAHFRNQGTDVHLGKIHFGFAEVLNKYVKEGIHDSVADLMEHDYKGYHIKVAGHSLGGAMASLLGVTLHIRIGADTPKIPVFTFGAPRVGERGHWADVSEDNIVHARTMYGADEVPCLAPKWTKYEHQDQYAIWIPRSTESNHELHFVGRNMDSCELQKDRNAKHPLQALGKGRFRGPNHFLNFYNSGLSDIAAALERSNAHAPTRHSHKN